VASAPLAPPPGSAYDRGWWHNIQYKASKLAFSDIDRNRRRRQNPTSPCAGVATGLLKTPST